MQLKPILMSFCCLLYGVALSQAGDDDRQRYVDKYGELAVQEMERTGVPASIKLGQAILESRWGTSELAQNAKNHFGIKCGGNWSGPSYFKGDDEYVGGKLKPSCFRAFSSVRESFIAHSNFLLANARYAELFALKTDDYKGWAKGLKKAGYATANYYHRSLINIIEELELYRYDRMSSADFRPVVEENPPEPVITEVKITEPSIIEPGVLAPNGPELRLKPEDAGPLQVSTNNDVKFVITRGGETLESLSDELDVPVRWLLSYNSKIDRATEELKAGEWIYLQPKRKNYRGQQRWHKVTAQDDMFSISQQYGISLHQLYERNLMIPGTEPEVGVQIKIRGWKVKTTPALRPIKAVEPIVEQATPPQKDYYTSASKTEKPRIGPSASPGGSAQLMMNQENSFGKAGKKQVSSGALFHRVAIGEDLHKIARQYNQSVEQLRKWNHLEANATLMIGMRLRVE